MSLRNSSRAPTSAAKEAEPAAEDLSSSLKSALKISGSNGTELCLDPIVLPLSNSPALCCVVLCCLWCGPVHVLQEAAAPASEEKNKQQEKDKDKEREKVRVKTSGPAAIEGLNLRQAMQAAKEQEQGQEK